MTNFEKYKENLSAERFADSMILNCGGCPAYPCTDSPTDGTECYDNLLAWCMEDVEEDKA